VLTLNHSLLTDEESNINGLREAIMFGHELVSEDGIPIQDYKIHPFNSKQMVKLKNTKKYLLKERQKQRFLDDVIEQIQ
jgi:hypothetical protein